MKEMNAFFSGSMKVFENTFPYFFPANIAIDGKGNTIDPTNMTINDFKFGMLTYAKGYIEK
jgi:hypothetical protein